MLTFSLWSRVSIHGKIQKSNCFRHDTKRTFTQSLTEGLIAAPAAAAATPVWGGPFPRRHYRRRRRPIRRPRTRSSGFLSTDVGSQSRHDFSQSVCTRQIACMLWKRWQRALCSRYLRGRCLSFIKSVPPSQLARERSPSRLCIGLSGARPTWADRKQAILGSWTPIALMKSRSRLRLTTPHELDHSLRHRQQRARRALSSTSIRRLRRRHGRGRRPRGFLSTNVCSTSSPIACHIRHDFSRSSCTRQIARMPWTQRVQRLAMEQMQQKETRWRCCKTACCWSSCHRMLCSKLGRWCKVLSPLSLERYLRVSRRCGSGASRALEAGMRIRSKSGPRKRV